MHRSRLLITSLILMLLVGESISIPSFATNINTGESKVVEAMRSMYVAATNDDLKKFHSVASPDFYAFDGGKRFSGDEIMGLIKNAHAAGMIFVWRVTEPQVHVDGKTAWITYVNQGSIKDSSGTKNVTWLESAILRKEDGRWHIAFLHSTRVPSQR